MKAAAGTYYSENRERVLAVARNTRIARGQPRVRLCRSCGNPARSSQHWLCARCATAARTRRHVRPDKAGKTKAQLGYGPEHVAARKRWKVKVDRGEVTCGYCGRPILPGEPFDLSHPFDDKSLPPEPWHRSENRSYAARITKQRRRP